MAEKTSSTDQQVAGKEEVFVNSDQREEEKTDRSEEEGNDRAVEMAPFCYHRTGKKARTADGDCCYCIKLVEQLNSTVSDQRKKKREERKGY